MKLICFLLFLWSVQPCFAHDAQAKRFAEWLHVCTVANKWHPNLQKLINSCNAHGIQLDILGMDKPYRSNTDKLRWMKKYCMRLPPDHLVLFIDAFDVLILANKEDIVSRFLQLKVPMLMAMEMNCWPPETAPLHPLTSSPFKYINTGCYMGWVKDVKNWLNAFNKSLLSENCDQVASHKLFLKNPHFYALDHWCQIFLCLAKLPSDALQIDEANKKIYCTYTNSFPCIIHANGKSFKLWNQVYSLFFEE